MDNALWTAATVVACIGLALCLYLMHGSQKGVPGLRALDAGFQCPDMRFHYNAEKLFEDFGRVGEPGRVLLTRFWRIDFGFIACFLVAMLAVDRNVAALVPIRYGMHGAAALRALLDVAENVMLMSVCRGYPQKRRIALANAAGVVTAAKWIAMGVWVVGLFINLFSVSIRL